MFNFAYGSAPRVVFFRGRSPVPPRAALRNLVNTLVEQNHTSQSYSVTDGAAVRHRAAHWRAHLPWIQPYYAVKANPSPGILQSLADSGVNFDVASQVEIEKLGEINGVDGTRMILSQPCKQEGDLTTMQAGGVRLTVADCADELHKIHHVLGPGVEILMRVLVDSNDDGDNESFSAIDRYGANEHEWSPFAALAEELGFRIRGICFHIGSGDERPGRPRAYMKALKRGRMAFDALLTAGVPPDQLNVVNIGGGFGGFQDLGDGTAQAIASCYHLFPNCTWMAEPGRFFSGTAQMRVARVIGIRGDSVTLNDGIYGGFSINRWDCEAIPTHEDMLPYDENGRQLEDFGLFKTYGPTCDGDDVVSEALALPNDIKTGDWVACNGMGSYSQACSTDFNGCYKFQEIVCSDPMEDTVDIISAIERETIFEPLKLQARALTY